ncbi:MAG: sodium:calcium antiporter, partial [Phycisphaerae bacterium]
LPVGGGGGPLLLLASVTSLPEVVTGGTATAIGNANLAFAGIFGSCSFNITLIVLLNALIGGGSVLRDVSHGHTLTSSFGVLLMSITLLGIVVVEKFRAFPLAAQTCEIVCAMLIVVTYLSCMRLMGRFERAQHTAQRQGGGHDAGGRDGGDDPEGGDGGDDRRDADENRKGGDDRADGDAREGGDDRADGDGSTRLYRRLAAISFVLVVASWWLARCGDVLGEHPIELIGRPLGATFVGAAFLAIATSLPEIVTSVTAVRLGNLDLALGNLFGSNMFNIFVFPMLKVVSLARGDALLMAGDAFDTTQNLIAGLLPVVLTAVTIGGLTYRSERKLLRRFGFDSVLIATIYLVGMALLLAR